MIKERISLLQKQLKDNNLDAYFLTTLDQHLSEYSSDYDKALRYMSGFTGSTGSFIVTCDCAYIWVDGRYHIQGDQQCAPYGIQVQKMGLEDVPTVQQFLKEKNIKVLGLDATLVDANTCISYAKESTIVSIDLVSSIWQDRGSRPLDKAFFYDVSYCGESRVDKLKRLQNELNDVNYHVLSTLDDIAWLFNIRGRAIKCNPFVRAFSIISPTTVNLYISEGTFNEDEINTLTNEGVTCLPYSDFYNDVKSLEGKALYDLRKINYEIYLQLNSSFEHVNKPNPTQLFKAIKNEVEISNTRNAHIKDGVAVTNFMYQLKHMKQGSDEVSLSDDLLNYRKVQDLFYDTSFDTICGYQANGASMHYFATPENHSKVELEGLLLVDSGGQYLDGTTDITRTFALGNVTQQQKDDFTMVLKAVLRLSNAKFIDGTTGNQLDMLAREMIYQHGLNYRCGTGHGIGHFLGVHEGPNGINGINMTVMKPGMITTNEPGIYHAGKYGIRLENEMLCKEDFTNEYGTFYSFETITYCPFDVDAINYDLLTIEEQTQLKQYHTMVFNTLTPHLSNEVNNWLKDFIK